MDNQTKRSLVLHFCCQVSGGDDVVDGISAAKIAIGEKCHWLYGSYNGGW